MEFQRRIDGEWTKMCPLGSIFLSAIAFRLISGFLLREDSADVQFYHVGKIRQTTVANFDIVFIEYFVELIGFRKVLLNKF